MFTISGKSLNPAITDAYHVLTILCSFLVLALWYVTHALHATLDQNPPKIQTKHTNTSLVSCTSLPRRLFWSPGKLVVGGGLLLWRLSYP